MRDLKYVVIFISLVSSGLVVSYLTGYILSTQLA